MSRLTKNKKAVQDKYDINKYYTVEEACKLVKEIIAERSKRIQQAKQEEMEIRRQKLRRKEELTDTAVMVGVILGCVFIVGGVAVAIILSI